MKHNYLILGLLSLALTACSGGENGIDGKDGKNGDSCTITNNEDGTATITCPDGSSFTIKNGENGQKGDAGSDGEKGQNGQSCKLVENADGSAAVICPADGTSYIVRGNTDNYADYCAPGYWGKNCIDCSVNSKNYGTADCSYTDTRDSNSEVVYPLVRIGNQLWMAKNMAFTGNEDIPIDCYANTDEDADFIKNYGCFYVSNDAKLACPAGWRLPTYADFETLLATTNAEVDSAVLRDTSFAGGTNTSGFSALAAGSKPGEFLDFGTSATFWSDTGTHDYYNTVYYLELYKNEIYFSADYPHYAHSVRCIRD